MLAFLNPESEMYTGKVILELLDAKSFHEEMLFHNQLILNGQISYKRTFI